jgi:hypothetical protein
MNVNYPDIFFYAVPNGEHRHPSVALRLKLEGVAKGVPDLVFPCARNGYHGLYIEMKRKKNSRVSTDQKKVIEILESYGNKVLVCKGAEEAQKAILEYFG